MSQEISDEEFIFCSFPNSQYGEYGELDPVGAILESEGLSLIIPRDKADSNDIEYGSIYK